MSSVVYVVQKKMRWDNQRQELVVQYDLSSAEKYGPLEFLLGANAGPFNTESVVAQLLEGLRAYTDLDYLLLIGNPCLIGFATAIAAQRTGGKVQMLQWSGTQRSYIPVRADLCEKRSE